MRQGERIGPNRVLFCGLSYYKKKGYARFLVEGELNHLQTDGGAGVVLEKGIIRVGEEIPIRRDVGHRGFPGGEPWPG